MNIMKEERIFEPSLFKDYLKSKLISLLDSIAGRKLLMLEQAVRVPINLVIQKRVFHQHQIPEDGGIAPFQVIPIDVNFDQIVIFLSPTVENLRKLKDLVLINIQKGNRKFYPVFWPKRTLATKQFLQSSNLSQYIQIKDFSFDLLPLDTDLYSLEMKILYDLYVEDNHSIYTTIAQSIHRLQSVFGRIHNIFGKGRAARSIFEILKLKEHEIKIDQNFGDIQHLIILDRASDFVTPLIRQTTYEGLVDQFFGIQGGIAKIPATEGAKEKKNEVVALNSQKDFIFQEIRILNILNGVQPVLKLRSVEHDELNSKALDSKDMNEKAALMKRLQLQQKFLKKHINLKNLLVQEMKTISFHKELVLQQQCIQEISKDIVQYFENLIPFQMPLQKVLRSMCLQSLIDKGIQKKLYNRICEDIVMTYGGQHIISLNNLAKLGLFYERGSKRQPYAFPQIKKELRLINDDSINHENPSDPSFAYGGFCPILTKLVEHAIRNGWKNCQKALKMIPGDVVLPDMIRQCRSHPRPAVVVYFVGGVTYGQIATLRLLGKILIGKQMIIATTQVINGDTMLEALLQKKTD